MSQKHWPYLGFLFLCAFSIPGHIFKNDSALAIFPSLPFCCSSANCVVLIVPAAATDFLTLSKPKTIGKLQANAREQEKSFIKYEFLPGSFFPVNTEIFFYFNCLEDKTIIFFHLRIQNKLHCVHKAALCCGSLLNETQHSFHVLVDHCSNCADFYLKQPQAERLHVLARNNNEKLLLLLSKCGSLG